MARLSFRMPHTLVLLFAMIVGAVLLTYVLPAGSYDRFENEHGRQQVLPGTYQLTPDVQAPSPLVVLTAIPRGMEAAAEIIFFIFIIGGAFAVLRASGAVDAMLGAVLRRLSHRPFWLVLGGILLFTAGSSSIGMAEEYLPFVPVLVALTLALGYDAVVGVGILTVGYSIGYAVAALNPFTVLIAQDIAGLQPASGMGFRLALLLVFVPIGMHHVWSYARRVRRDPSASLVKDIAPPATEQTYQQMSFTATHKAVIGAVLLMLAVLVYGLARWEWYLIEMSALFLGLTVVMAAIARLDPDVGATTFIAGAAELTGTALLVGFARAIQVVLEQGGVIDTIVHALSIPLRTLGPELAAVGMFLVQSVTNFFIPSGSGQAYVTMPIMAPLAEVVGVSKQVAVLAYQLGDGFSNVILPTNAVLIGILAIAGIPFDRWVRFIGPFVLKNIVVGSIVLVIAVMMGYS